MAITELSLAQRTFAALVSAGADPTKIKMPNLLALIPDALELLGNRAAAAEDYEGMQTDFAALPVLGFLDLSSLTGILFDIARSRIRVTSSNATLRPVDSYETLEHGNLPADQIWYAQDGWTLRFRSTTPALNDYAVALKIRANYIPSLTDANRSLDGYEGAAVRTMVELASGAEAPGEARELAEGKR